MTDDPNPEQAQLDLLLAVEELWAADWTRDKIIAEVNRIYEALEREYGIVVDLHREIVIEGGAVEQNDDQLALDVGKQP